MTDTPIDLAAALARLVAKFGAGVLPEWIQVRGQGRQAIMSLGGFLAHNDIVPHAWAGWLVDRLRLDVIRIADGMLRVSWGCAPGYPAAAGPTLLAACLDLLTRWPSGADRRAIDNPFEEEKP